VVLDGNREYKAIDTYSATDQVNVTIYEYHDMEYSLHDLTITNEVARTGIANRTGEQRCNVGGTASR
jgi:hypothetical protein